MSIPEHSTTNNNAKLINEFFLNKMQIMIMGKAKMCLVQLKDHDIKVINDQDD